MKRLTLAGVPELAGCRHSPLASSGTELLSCGYDAVMLMSVMAG
ncbi:hypothetical protein [Erwinia endophytica]|nr:hypothetical protein [Erwinia endophytica]